VWSRGVAAAACALDVSCGLRECRLVVVMVVAAASLVACMFRLKRLYFTRPAHALHWMWLL
jgi:hypothetical protein